MSSSTWRVLRGYATYQRTPIRITSGGKCAPLKLIAMSRSLMLYRWSWREIIPQRASKENLRQNRKSSLCLRCAKVYVDTWVSQVSKMLHAGVIYRHIILTVPAMFRTTFYQNAAVVLSALMRCGAQCLDDFYSAVKGKALRGGSIVVLHTHGRNGQYHPHLHVIATSGGYDGQQARWEHLEYLPYALLRRKWQWHLLTMLRQTLQTEAVKRLVDTCFTTYPEGLVTNGQKGQVPAQYQSLARYVAQYVVSPPSAVRRIDR